MYGPRKPKVMQEIVEATRGIVLPWEWSDDND